MIKKSLTLLIFSSLLFLSVEAQTKKKQDRNAIKAMCGCYEVTFNFAETFQYSDDPEYKPSKAKSVGGLEWVQLVEETKDKFVMQHLLIVGKPDNPQVIKHWRQDWLYENTDLYVYDHDNNWKFVQLPKKEVKGQWTQKVFQTDDGPRYEGTATWVHIDGKSYWESATDAPLPRREYTKRSDYNVTLRGNRHEIIKDGWVHKQDNKKIVREPGKKDAVLAEEVGYNTYIKVADAKCKAAQGWWKENKTLWNKVRMQWDAVYAKNKDLILNSKVKNKTLSSHLFKLESDVEAKTVRQIIDTFVSSADGSK